jgi:hypothetical protein
MIFSIFKLEDPSYAPTFWFTINSFHIYVFTRGKSVGKCTIVPKFKETATTCRILEIEEVYFNTRNSKNSEGIVNCDEE